MTVDEHDINNDSSSSSSFQGLMQSLNLDASDFKEYQTDGILAPTQSFTQLSEIKQDMERQLGVLFDLLRHKYGADMDTPLVTADGYPRSDVDVVSVRLIRVRIIRLKNDYRAVLRAIDEKMAGEFAKRQAENPREVEEGSRERERRREYSIPFAKVAEVVSGGPAHLAGLQENDEIVLFDDDIHAVNNNRLRNLASRVKVGRSISVQVKRNNEMVSLTLIPSDDWDGQGLLGCRLIPI
ncbi:26S proteasome non-ATPase regulatory subunit 9 [Candida viswanathii]|uniref:Probable 26S proteasome regulatory subunit p27 n=1 Tax=Candida viswanathii TaxID=5486 RepID=A0A367XTQ9_9ASCO|nr:26S proteasome non-ATPase regulatory subunit 9 [Candida viswanathii]